MLLGRQMIYAQLVVIAAPVNIPTRLAMQMSLQALTMSLCKLSCMDLTTHPTDFCRTSDLAPDDTQVQCRWSRQWRQAQAGAEAESEGGVPLYGIAFERLHELGHLVCVLRTIERCEYSGLRMGYDAERFPGTFTLPRQAQGCLHECHCSMR